MLERKTFEDAAVADAGLMIDREPELLEKVKLPQGLKIVSADNHIEITEDLFWENFPPEMRDQAPRVWFDKYWRIGYETGVQAIPQGFELIEDALERSVLNDGFQFQVRNRHLDAELIAKEIVYPQTLMGFVRYPDPNVQEQLYRTYNEYLARLQAENPGRFYGVGICSNWWDPKKADAAIQQLVDLGLKTFLIPFSPGKDLEGNLIDYASPEMEPFWAAAESAGLPVSFHISEVPASMGRGSFGTFFLVQAAPFRRVFGNMIFGGILDRHPNLRVVFAEGGINWVAGALQDAELTWDVHLDIYDIKPKHRPTYYWHNNMYATFQTDRIGLRLLDQLGADRVMWAQDYPHSEGTFGYTARAVEEVLDASSEADARKILGDTAISLYKLD